MSSSYKSTVRESPSPASPQLEQPVNVLIVEDTYEVQQALAMFLRTLGYKIACASTPEEALDRISSQPFDLVLLDLNYRRDTTSGAEGLQLLSLLRARGIDAPIIVMTAWGSIDVAVKAMHNGAVDFLQKPWDNSHLERMVRQHVAQQFAVRRERRRQQLEWEDAVAVQRRFIPREFPQIPGFSMAAISRPVGQIGGDYYDVFCMGDKLAVCIGDVVGKGIPAALMMSNLQAAVKVTAAHWVSPSEVCRRVNELACSNGESDKLISFFYGVIDIPTRTITYCNCGHNAPILAHQEAPPERLYAGGTLIGFRCDEAFTEASAALTKGDALFLFTDGLSEAENADAEGYGEDRLVQHVMRGAAGDQSPTSAQELLDTLCADVARHCNGQFQDDVTCVMICA